MKTLHNVTTRKRFPQSLKVFLVVEVIKQDVCK